MLHVNGIHDRLWLASFTWHSVFKDHTWWSIHILILLFLWDMSQNGYIPFYLCVISWWTFWLFLLFDYYELVQVFMYVYIFLLATYIVELFGQMMTVFNFLNCQAIIQSCCTIIYFHQQYVRVSVSTNSGKCLLLFCVFIVLILLCMI